MRSCIKESAIGKTERNLTDRPYKDNNREMMQQTEVRKKDRCEMLEVR
jgi:hypothetical protein